MTFDDYVSALKSTGLFGKDKVRIGLKLFEYAGSHKEISDSAIKSWLKHSRKCNIQRYFPDELTNDDQFIKFFRDKTGAPDSWKEIQKAFQSIMTNDLMRKDCVVDLDTNDRNTFFRSLLTQFQRIFHLTETNYKEDDSATSDWINLAILETVTNFPQQTDDSNASSNSSCTKPNNSEEIVDSTEQIINCGEASSLNFAALFEQKLKFYEIDEFIGKVSPIRLLNPDWLDKCEEFINDINTNILSPYFTTKPCDASSTL